MYPYIRTTMDVYGTRYVDLNLVSAEAVRTWTFGDKLAGEPISFKKGDKENIRRIPLLFVYLQQMQLWIKA